MDEYGITFDKMVQNEKEKGVEDLKKQVNKSCHTTTLTNAAGHVSNANLSNPEILTPLPSVTPVTAVVTGTLNSSNLVLNVNLTRAREAITCNDSELQISCSIVDGRCLPTTTSAAESAGQSSGFNVVVDNWDMKQEVRNMSSQHQNVDIHWVNHSIVENRVSGNHLPDDKPVKDIKDVQNKDLLPSMADHKALYDNYIIHIQRILVKRIPSLKCFAECVPKHIIHKHSKEMNQKSKKVITTDGFLMSFLVCSMHICIMNAYNLKSTHNNMTFENNTYSI